MQRRPGRGYGWYEHKMSRWAVVFPWLPLRQLARRWTLERLYIVYISCSLSLSFSLNAIIIGNALPDHAFHNDNGGLPQPLCNPTKMATALGRSSSGSYQSPKQTDMVNARQDNLTPSILETKSEPLRFWPSQHSSSNIQSFNLSCHS